jgi:hypothetical protein
VQLGARGLDNRWVIALTSMEARDELMRLGLFLFNKRVPLRLYDDVLQEEYTEFQEYIQLQERLFGNVMPDDDVMEEPDKLQFKEDTDLNKKRKKKRGKNKQKNDGIDRFDKNIDDVNDNKQTTEHGSANKPGDLDSDHSDCDKEGHRRNILHDIDSSNPLNEDVIIANMSGLH